MEGETTVIETGGSDAAAAEALADVASQAIAETAERTEQLTLAVAEIAGARAELSALRSEFIVHVEGNNGDFAGMRERLERLESGVAIMQAALEEAAEELEEIEDEAEEALKTAEAASVEVAEAEEPKPVEETAPVHIESRRERRRFIRI